MAAACCECRGPSNAGGAGGGRSNLPLICLVPREDGRLPPKPGGKPGPAQAGVHSHNDFKILDENYIKKHFKLPQRALYLDPFRRPLITFPMTQEGGSQNFNLARKFKVNQQILDGFLDPSEAITAPSVFPYAVSKSDKGKTAEDDEEIIYILQLPDWEFKCPIHNSTVRTPRFIWHSCKKQKAEKTSEPKHGGGPMNKPKPWLLSRHTDFDLMSQW